MRCYWCDAGNGTRVHRVSLELTAEEARAVHEALGGFLNDSVLSGLTDLPQATFIAVDATHKALTRLVDHNKAIHTANRREPPSEPDPRPRSWRCEGAGD